MTHAEQLTLYDSIDRLACALGLKAYLRWPDRLTREEWIQEARIAGWEAVGRYDPTHPSRAKLSTFATHWIRGRLSTAARVRKQDPLQLLGESDVSLPGHEIQVELRDAIAHAIECLTPKQRHDFEMRLLGHSYREIGESRGVSPQRIEQSLRDARERLRLRLARDYE